MAATSLADSLRFASQSFQFQQLLRTNPVLAKRAERDRDQVALDFLRAKNFSSDYTTQVRADEVLGEYDPERLYVTYYEPPQARTDAYLNYLVMPTYDSEADPYEFTASRWCRAYQPQPYVALGTRFNFTKDKGSALYIVLDATSLVGANPNLTNLQVEVYNATDLKEDGSPAFDVYYSTEGSSDFNEVVSTYTKVNLTNGVGNIGFSDSRGRVPMVLHHTGELTVGMCTLVVTAHN